MYFDFAAPALVSAVVLAAGFSVMHMHKKRPREQESAGDDAPLEELQIGEETLAKPIRGKVVSLEAVGDPTFSSKVLGEGVAILPEEGKVFAPFDGTVAGLVDTCHALALKSDKGLDVLIHVGLDSVRLAGAGFLPRVKERQHFKAGDLLLEFNLDFLKEEGCRVITPVIVSRHGN